MPYLWASGDTTDLPTVLEADPSTENVEVLTELEDELLLRMEWVSHIRILVYVMTEEDATILDAVGKEGRWHFRILFPERDSVSSTNDFCEEYDIGLEVERIYELTDSFRRGRFGLTEDQYETLADAYAAGYYSVPRETNLKGLAADGEVSHQALSERIRRGHERLVENALRPDPGEEQ